MNIVFDIETIPLPDNEYTRQQLEFIDKKLQQAIKADPTVDQEDEVRKIKSVSAFLGRIACIGMYFPESDRTVSLADPNERVILNKFWNEISDRKVTNPTFITYNGVRFDVPFIIRRSMYHGILPTSRAFMQYQKYISYPPHYDVAAQLCGKEQMIGLDLACSFLGVASSKEGAVKASGVAQAYAEGRISDIMTYCLEDVKATYALFNVVHQYY